MTLAIAAAYNSTKIDSQLLTIVITLLWLGAICYSDLGSIQWPLVNFRTRVKEELLENMIDRINGMSMEELEEDFTKIVDEAIKKRFIY